MPKSAPDLSTINSRVGNWTPREYRTPTGALTPNHYQPTLLKTEQMKEKTEEEWMKEITQPASRNDESAMLQSQMADLFQRQYKREQQQKTSIPKLDAIDSNSSSTPPISTPEPLKNTPDKASRRSRNLIPGTAQKIQQWLRR